MSHTIYTLFEQRYLLNNQHDYARWMKQFQNIACNTERTSRDRKCSHMIITYYTTLIKALQQYCRNNQQCYIIENEANMFRPYSIVLC